MSRLDVDRVTVRFGDRAVLDEASLRVAHGDVVALLGPSGSGKSTLLRVIAGLVHTDAGHVLIDGIDVTALPTHRRGVGMVFQDNQLFPHRSVGDNVEFGLAMTGVARRARKVTARRWLARVGLDGVADRRVGTLSGGEAKRVALARTLAPEPGIVLLDEPLTGLDADLHDRLAQDLATLLRATATTAVLVTHDRAEAAAIADRSVELGDLQAVAVRTVEAAATHDLRRRVLRRDTPTAEVSWEGDDDPSTVHLGAYAGGRLIGVATWLVTAFPGAPDQRARRLRGMAVEPDRRGTGVGTRLLHAGTEMARAEGATLVWAQARSTALGFYTDAGWQVIGDDFVDPTTALPHHTVLCRL